MRSGGASVLSANNAGNVTVVNTMTTNGINNGNDGITNAGAVSGVTTLTTSSNATIGGTLGVTGASTFSGGATSNSGFVANSGAGTGHNLTVNGDGTSITSSNAAHSLSVTDTTTTVNGGATIFSGTGTGNSVTVGATQSGTIGGSNFDYGTTVDGGLFVDGDVGINGNLYTLDSSADASVKVGNNGVDITGSSNEVNLTADDDSSDTNARAQVSLTPTSGSLLVNTDSGVSHGLTVNQTQAVLSGGTTSTSLTLDDSGATFRNDTTGGPARVTGVADGSSDFDAVNYRQLRKAYSGIASVAALAAIPQPAEGKTFSIGAGMGNYEDETSAALGFKAVVGNSRSVIFTAGVGFNDGDAVTNAGVSWSF